MRPDCQLQAFNAEMTSSSTIVLSPCSHSCPSTLVPSFGDDREGCGGWRIVLSSQDTSCRGHDVPRRFLLVAVGLPQPSLDVFLLGWALGLFIRNGPGRPNPLAPQQPLKILLSGTLDGKQGFDILGPITWLIELCFLAGARASSVIHGTFLAFQRTRHIAINISSSGIMRIALEYGKRIQWCLYEAAWIWRLKAPLGTGWNLFRLTFFP